MILDKRVLVIEDNPDIRQSVCQLLREMGFLVSEESAGRQGLYTALAQDFALIVLDLGLPELGGMEICRLVREKKPQQPILILTAEPDEMTMVLGLELGADDYVHKPFSAATLKARVRSLLRRVNALEEYAETLAAGKADEQRVVSFEELQLDLLQRTATIAGAELDLTPTEFDLLAALCAHTNQYLDTDQLFQLVWGEAANYDINVRTHIANLRSKLETHAAAPEIANKRGSGYRLTGKKVA